MRTWLNSLVWRWRSRQFRLAPRLPAILRYHSVSHRARDPLLLGIAPERFAAHLDWLARHTQPLPLAEFVRRHEEGTLPANAVALTFDDGYADNFTIAEPLLRERGIPATVFMATDYLNSPGEGWWEELDAILLESPRLPAEFRSEDFSCRVEERPNSARAGWTLRDAPETLREKAFLAARSLARRLRRSQRHRLLTQLRDWSGHDGNARPGHGFATWAMVRAAQRRGVLSIGAHTRSHPALARLAPAEQVAEILGSCTALHNNLGAAPAGFAYPFGTHHDFSPATIDAVRECPAGFACATMPAHLDANCSRWELPRLPVRDWEVPELAARLGA